MLQMELHILFFKSLLIFIVKIASFENENEKNKKYFPKKFF